MSGKPEDESPSIIRTGGHMSPGQRPGQPSDEPATEPISRERRQRLAVLIDAENIGAGMMVPLFRELHRIGDPVVRRVFGDFTSAPGSKWAEATERLGLEPRHQFTAVPAKNTVDIRLTIEAMDLLHAGQAEAFCLVTSDADFAPLATRIREQGLPVHGFGTITAATQFRRACSRFTYLENLYANAPSNDPASCRKPLRPMTDAVPILKAALVQATVHGGWVSIDELGHVLAREHVDFDVRTYGHRSLRELLRTLPRFQLDAPLDGIVRVRHGGQPKKRRKVRPTLPPNGGAKNAQSVATTERALATELDGVPAKADSAPRRPVAARE